MRLITKGFDPITVSVDCWGEIKACKCYDWGPDQAHSFAFGMTILRRRNKNIYVRAARKFADSPWTNRIGAMNELRG